jgi:CMP/dCMP kinase
MIVAIDGPAGVGKSTVSKMVAARLGLLFINSGSFYRAVAYKHLQQGKDPNNTRAIVETAQHCHFDVDSRGSLLLDGRPVEHLLRTPEIDASSSSFSSITEVRKIINEALRKTAGTRDIIMEGRDITTVVFPYAEHKFYFDGSLEERTRRRLQDYNNEQPFETMKDEINRRDYNDTHKEFGALKRAPDAFYIDTSYLTIDEVCDKVVQKILDNTQLKDQESTGGNREQCREE